ncbi:hypothetical protein EVAR_78532_1 [Eumeta japonica]|uniref:Uncharacterized protein n=1 Tax=Eumeta variegata TaxID=151549 RepID=A0A4C1W8K3_EUMVA|nr:hypothetical protein EVAR_78532_1 [Eumeta japonica]
MNSFRLAADGTDLCINKCGIETVFHGFRPPTATYRRRLDSAINTALGHDGDARATARRLAARLGAPAEPLVDRPRPNCMSIVSCRLCSNEENGHDHLFIIRSAVPKSMKPD